MLGGLEGKLATEVFLDDRNGFMIHPCTKPTGTPMLLLVPELYRCIDELLSAGGRPANWIVIAEQIILLICAQEFAAVRCFVEPR